MADAQPLTYASIRASGAEKPYYRALEDAFLAPHSVGKGSTFRTWAPPSYTWEALNQTAKDMFEVWYNEETTRLDELGRKTKDKFKHHERYRAVVTQPGEVFEAEIVSGPPVQDASTIKSLAEVMYSGARPTDPRPGPEASLPPRSDDGADIEEVKPPSTLASERPARQRA